MLVRIALLGCALPLVGAPIAAAQDNGGGAYPSLPPVVERITCHKRCGADGSGGFGSVFRIHGRSMDGVHWAVFLGGPGPRDDVVVPTRRARPRWVAVKVPEGAPAGRVRLRKLDGTPSQPSVAITRLSGGPAPPPRAAPSRSSAYHVFPIPGFHDLGGPGAMFGAPRNGHTHQGQDVMAPCGSRLIAARGGVVVFAAWQANAGNYVVIRGDDDLDYVYMHLQAPTPHARGALVATGQEIGAVGDTGNAQGCHLHFELWSAPGWYEGGTPFDPLPQLRAWDSVS